jgi:hypothetical protein
MRHLQDFLFAPDYVFFGHHKFDRSSNNFFVTRLLLNRLNNRQLVLSEALCKLSGAKGAKLIDC